MIGDGLGPHRPPQHVLLQEPQGEPQGFGHRGGLKLEGQLSAVADEAEPDQLGRQREMRVASVGRGDPGVSDLKLRVGPQEAQLSDQKGKNEVHRLVSRRMTISYSARMSSMLFTSPPAGSCST